MTLNQSIQSAQTLIAEFLNSNHVNNSLVTAFGNDFPTSAGISLLQSLATENTSLNIELVPSSTINNAFGAYAGTTNTIYLAQELVADNDINTITRVLLEEIGHYIDAQLNPVDAPGDEGAIFASLVLGEELDNHQLALLQAEDDTVIVNLDGENLQIEQAGVIYVDADAVGGNNNGTSWDNAYTNLQSALAVAGASDQIWVAEGTYKPTTDNNREVSFVINNGVKVFGGFAGEEKYLEQRDWRNHPTILSGNIGDPSGQNDNSYHIVDISNSVAATVIDGFTVTAGQADGENNFDNRRGRGGGFYGRDNASATLRNLVVTNNFAADDGGGVYLGDNNSPSIINVTFINNSASDNGGAIYFGNSNSLNVFNSLFVNNQSSGGGAIHTNVITTLNVVNNTFYNNQGGTADGIFDDTSSAGSTVINRTIINNIFWNDAGIDRTQVFLDDLSDENIVISNNIIKGASPLPGDRDVVGEGNITEDPQFVDAANGNYRLRLGSPGIDGGNNQANSLGTDLVNNPRIFNNTVDIGAYEYGLFFNIDDATIDEGNSDTTNLEFTVTLKDSLGQSSTEEIAVNYTIVEDNANVDSDYSLVPDGTLIFAPGETTKTITVPVLGDTDFESDETFFVQLSQPSSGAAIADERAVGTIRNDDVPQSLDLFRFRNQTYTTGTYVFVGAEERDGILSDANSSNTFSLDGRGGDGSINPAFKASTIAGDNLLPFFRLENLVNPGTFLYVSTEEYNGIFADNSPQKDQWRRQGFDDQGIDVPEFYLYGGSSSVGIEFHRFQNLENGTFLYAGPEETNGINNDPNLSNIFVDQGVAFKSLL